MATVEELSAQYLQLLDKVDHLSGPPLRRTVERIFAISDQIKRKDPRFDWLAFWKQAGIPMLNTPLEVADEVSPDPVGVVVEDWTDLD